ncbi:MAG: histidine triad nucleotide-binding protein [Planctomycetes bacterium]|nr:histidine triad nucleotide-binding protein [Planctomycetota bacterium]
MNEKTIFQRIFDGEIPSKMVYEDDLCGAFHDIEPQAPTHVLIVPRKPIPGISSLMAEDEEVVGHLFRVARRVAKTLGLDNGFRLVINDGADGMQSVPHLHVHLLGGRQLTWPPG